MLGVGLRFSQLVSQVQREHPIEAPAGGDEVPTRFIDLGEESEHRSLGRLVTKLDVVFRGIVQAAFGLDEVALVEEVFAELAVGHCESLLIADDPVMLERELERGEGLLPLAVARLLQCEVVVENTERAVVLQFTQEIQRFEVVGAGFVGTVGADVEVAEIDQCMGDGLPIRFRPLNAENLAVALFRAVEIVHECAGIAEIAQGVGEFPLVTGGAIVGHRRFPGRTGMDQIAAMEKNPCPVFMVV